MSEITRKQRKQGFVRNGRGYRMPIAIIESRELARKNNIALIRELLGKGLTPKEIANKVGVSPASIYNYIRRYDI